MLQSLASLLAWCRSAPEGTSVDAHALAEIIERVGDSPEAPRLEVNHPRITDAWTWRERLWTCPADTRLGVTELAEALGRPKSWIYERTSAKAIERAAAKGRAIDPLPHEKLDGVLMFRAGEVRWWLRSAAEPVVECPSESIAAERIGWGDTRPIVTGQG